MKIRAAAFIVVKHFVQLAVLYKNTFSNNVSSRLQNKFVWLKWIPITLSEISRVTEIV